MRTIIRGTAAVFLAVLLSLPAAAAPKSVTPGSFFKAFKQFIIRAASRISPPVGDPCPPPPDGQEEVGTQPATP